MAWPKAFTRMEEKLDRILAILEAPTFPILEETPTPIDPAAMAASIDYDSYSAKEIAARVASLTTEERAALAIYEAAHANRKTVLAALNAGRAEDGQAADGAEGGARPEGDQGMGA